MKKEILLSSAALMLTLIVLELVFRIVWENGMWWVRVESKPIYQYPINKYCFRDFDYEKEKPKATVRIVCVGDSITWGIGVKFDDSYPKRLERSLNYFYGPKTGKRYEVLNTSWPGYSTFQQINRLEFIKSFQPDLILWGYYLNDSENWADPKRVIALRHRFLLRKNPGKFSKFLCHNSYLISFICNRLSNLRIAWGNVEYYEAIYEDSYMGWIRTKGCFQILGRQKTPVLVLVFPLVSYNLDREYPFGDIHKKISKELDENGLHYIDFLGAFKDEDRIRLEVVPYKDAHLSEIAHRIVEEAVYQKLVSNYKDILE